MTASSLHFNPFAQLLSPESVSQALHASRTLSGLRSKVHRPLDRPLLQRRAAASLTEFDALIDAELDESFDDEDLDVLDDEFLSVSRPVLFG